MEKSKKSKAKTVAKKPAAKTKAKPAPKKVAAKKETKKKIVRKPRVKPEPMGRPPKYDPEYGSMICDRIATTTLSIKKLCEMEDMPCSRVFWYWMFKHEDFLRKYEKAKEAQQHLVMESVGNVFEEDLHKYTDAQGNIRIDAPSATLIAKKLEHMRWFAARVAPRKYGDKQIIETVDKNNTEMQERLAKLEKELDKKNQKDY